MTERFYIYAITDAGIRLPDDIAGFGGPVFVATYDGLGAVVSQVAADEAPAGARGARPEHLLRHEAVVEAIHAAGRALPVRFGTTLASGEAVTQALAQRHATLLHDLQRIGDRIEVGVSALWRGAEDAAAVPASPGRAPDQRAAPETPSETATQRPGMAYLRARQVELRRAESAQARAQALASELDAALGPLARQWRHSASPSGPSGRITLRALYLLERERLSACEQAFQQVRRRHPETQLLLSGPWPPYSFITSSTTKGQDSL